MAKFIPHHKEYSFEEWNNLPYETKRDIWNHYWNPYHPKIGQQTRDAIIAEFKRIYSDITDEVFAIGYGYFGWDVGCIYIVVSNSSIRVPKEFASVMINKGTVEKRLDKETLLVNWRYGDSRATFKIET